MPDLKEVQAVNAERVVSQLLAVRKELRSWVEDADLDKMAATLTTGLISSDEWAKANGFTEGKPKHLTPPRG